MALLEQSTTVTVQMGPFLDATDGKTEETALSPTVEVSKAGAAFAARNSATAITHDAEGWYRVELDTTDTGTLGRLIAKAHDSANHLPVWHEFDVVDSINEPDVNVTKISGSAAAANNLELDYDGTGYAKGASSSVAAAGQVSGDVTGNLQGNVSGDVDGSVKGMVMQSTTIATLASQTSFTLTDGSADDDAYNGMAILVEDAATTEQRCVGLISDYTGSTKTVTLIADPGIFTMAATDLVRIFPLGSVNVHKIENTAGKAAINAEVDSSIETYNLDHFMAAAVVGTDVVDDSALAQIVSKSATADWDDFVNTTDSLQAARDKLTDIETDTAEIGAGGAGLDSITWNASWDTEVQSECADAITAASLPTAAQIEDEILDAVISRTAHNTISTVGRYIRYASQAQQVTDEGLAQAGAATSITLASTASTTDDFYNGEVIHLFEGTGIGQWNIITDYTGSTRVADVLNTWGTNPDATTGYVVSAGGIANTVAVEGADATTQIATAALTTQMTESYAADGVAPTLTQANMLILQMLTEMSISSTTMTIKKLDGSTTAATLTLNDADTPTSVTRAT